MQLLKKVAIAAWVLSIPLGTRYILRDLNEFGALQYLEYTTPYIALASFAHLLVIAVFWKYSFRLVRNTSTLLAGIFGAVSLLSSPIVGTALGWLFFLTIWLISLSAIVSSLKFSKELWRFFIVCIALIGSFEAVLGVFQFALQHDLGFNLFGEPVANSSTLGVAKIVQNGEKLLRPFGTFPHANVFGGFLVACIMAMLSQYYWLAKKSFLLFQLSVGLMGFGILLSFSRSAWVALFLGILFSFRTRVLKILFPVVAALTIAIFLFGPSIQDRFILSEQSAQLDVRSVGLNFAKQIIWSEPLGLGIRGFIPRFLESLPNLDYYYYQPVHNSLMFLISEIGIPVFLVLILFCFWKLYIHRKAIWTPVIWCMIPLALLDHFLVSLPQGVGILGLMCVLLLVPRATGTYRRPAVLAN